MCGVCVLRVCEWAHVVAEVVELYVCDKVQRARNERAQGQGLPTGLCTHLTPAPSCEVCVNLPRRFAGQLDPSHHLGHHPTAGHHPIEMRQDCMCSTGVFPTRDTMCWCWNIQEEEEDDDAEEEEEEETKPMGKVAKWNDAPNTHTHTHTTALYPSRD
jgi:hypothetical protein